MAGITDIFTDLGTTLSGVAPVLVGAKERARNVDCPYYFIYPMRERYKPSQGAGFSGNPRMLAQRDVDVEIQSWGIDYAQAETLNACVVQALRTILKGANYVLGGAEWHDPQNMERGAVLVLTVTFILGLPEQKLTAPLGDKTYQSVVIETIEPDPADVDEGDGTFQAGESLP